MSEEPTMAAVRAAVLQLPLDDLRELAKGPIVDLCDEDRCRVCELYDDFIYGTPPYVPYRDAVLTLIDWHRWHGSPTHDGRGPEAARRCKFIYAVAASRIPVQEAAHKDGLVPEAIIVLSFPRLPAEEARARAEAIVAILERRDDLSPVLRHELGWREVV